MEFFNFVLFTILITYLLHRIHKQEDCIKQLQSQLDNLKKNLSQQETTIQQPVDNSCVQSLVDKDKTKKHEKEMIKKNLDSKSKKQLKDILVRIHAYFEGALTLESVISKLGALLLLIGVGYLFRLAYERGFLTQEIIIILGYLAGVGICYLGLKFLKMQRYIFSQVIFGFGSALLYITTFSAYQYYHIFGMITAFILLLFITMVVYALALVVNCASMSIVATFGALVIPFAVGISNLVGVMGIGIYLVIIALLAMVIYYRRRWLSLYITTSVAQIVILNLLSVLLTFTSTEQTLFIVLTGIMTLICVVPLLIYTNDNEKSQVVASVKILMSIMLPLGFEASLNSLPNSDKYLVGCFFMLVSILYLSKILFVFNKKQSIHRLIILYVVAEVFLVLSLIILLPKYYIAAALLVLSVALINLHRLFKHRFSRWVFNSVFILGLIYYIAYAEDILSLISYCLISIIIMACITIDWMFAQNQIKMMIEWTGLMMIAIFILNQSILVHMISPLREHLFIVANSVLLCLYCLFYDRLNQFNLSAIKYLVYGYSSVMLGFSFYQLFDHKAYIGSTIIALLVLFGIAHILQRKLAKYYLHCAMYSLFFKFALFDVPIVTNNLRYGIMFFAIVMILSQRYYFTSKERYAIMWRKFTILWLICFIVCYTWLAIASTTFDLIDLGINIVNMYVFNQMLCLFNLSKRIKYGIITTMVVYISIQNIAIPLNNKHIVTLIWAMYTVLAFIYYLRQNDKRMVHMALLTIISVVIKFIVFDLSTASIVSRVVTSIIFGMMLLGLSYGIPSLMKRVNADHK